jgi:hypothetical protein
LAWAASNHLSTTLARQPINGGNYWRWVNHEEVSAPRNDWSCLALLGVARSVSKSFYGDGTLFALCGSKAVNAWAAI